MEIEKCPWNRPMSAKTNEKTRLSMAQILLHTISKIKQNPEYERIIVLRILFWF
jgi:hypothetical protein